MVLAHTTSHRHAGLYVDPGGVDRDRSGPVTRTPHSERHTRDILEISISHVGHALSHLGHWSHPLTSGQTRSKRQCLIAIILEKSKAGFDLPRQYTCQRNAKVTKIASLIDL